MADRVYPSAKPNPPPPHPSAPSSHPPPPSFPPTKSQLYNRPPYRPHPPPKLPRSRRRRCCRAFCCSLALILISLILLAALAAGIFYILYRPQRPNFSISSLQLSSLNVSSSNQVTSKLTLAVTARNPNKKIAFLYDPISISVASDGVDFGDGSFPGFVHGKKNTTVMRATVKSSGESLDSAAAGSLKKKSSVDLVIDLETKAGVKVGAVKTKRMGIRVHCEGIRVDVPKGRKVPTALTPDVSCKVKLRIKIWKWTF